MKSPEMPPLTCTHFESLVTLVSWGYRSPLYHFHTLAVRRGSPLFVIWFFVTIVEIIILPMVHRIRHRTRRVGININSPRLRSPRKVIRRMRVKLESRPVTLVLVVRLVNAQILNLGPETLDTLLHQDELAFDVRSPSRRFLFAVEGKTAIRMIDS